MKKVELLGIDEIVEYNEENTFTYYEEDNIEYQAVITVDGRLIVFDESFNSWIQIKP